LAPGDDEILHAIAPDRRQVSPDPDLAHANTRPMVAAGKRANSRASCSTPMAPTCTFAPFNDVRSDVGVTGRPSGFLTSPSTPQVASRAASNAWETASR